jgi:condensin complex subunit 2
MTQMLEKMKQGDHVFDRNAEAEPDEEECQDFGDSFDGDEEGQGDYGGEGFKEHKDGCKAGGLGRGR